MSTYQVRSLEEADLIIKQHERKTKTNYALLRSTKNFGCIDVSACSNEEYEVRFETVGVPYCGVPFFVAGLKILQCQSFKEKPGRLPAKSKEIKIELTGSGASVIGADVTDIPHASDAAELPRVLPTRKKKKSAGGRVPRVSCTATIIMKEVIYYPEFQLFEHSKNNRLGVARQLKEVLRSKAAVQKDRIIYVTVPTSTDHFGHPIGTVVNVKIPNKRIYVKNDYYGPMDASSDGPPAKRLYFPVKEEKTSKSGSGGADSPIMGSSPAPSYYNDTKQVEMDSVGKAKEVREVLQSIMAFTYKSGNFEAFQELHVDLINAKQKYMNMIESQNHTVVKQQQIQQQRQQIVFVKQPKQQQQQQIAPRQISQQRPLQIKNQQQQQQQQMLQVQQMEQVPSTLSITINAIPALSVASTPLAAASIASSLSTLNVLPTIALPTVCLSANSLPGIPNGSIPITTIPPLSTVVVPSGIQPQAVTLTIPAGSLSSLHPGTLTSFPNGSVATFPARSVVSVAAGSSTSSIPVGTLSTIQADALSSIQAGVIPSIHSSLPSIVAASITPMQSIVSVTSSSESISVNAMSTVSVPSIAAVRSSSSTLPSIHANISTLPVGNLTSNLTSNTWNHCIISPVPSSLPPSVTVNSLPILTPGTIIPSICLSTANVGHAIVAAPAGPGRVAVAIRHTGVSSPTNGVTWSQPATVASTTSADVNSKNTVVSSIGTTTAPPVQATTMQQQQIQQQMLVQQTKQQPQDSATNPPTSSAATTTTQVSQSSLAAASGNSAVSTATAATTTDGGSNQETSIFIEAMEAILNSHI